MGGVGVDARQSSAPGCRWQARLSEPTATPWTPALPWTTPSAGLGFVLKGVHSQVSGPTPSGGRVRSEGLEQ